MPHLQPLQCEILMPVYNGGEQVRHCLESVLATLPAGCGVTVLDDASTDLQLLAWLDARQAADARLCVRHFEQNLGFVGNVNRGLAAATTDVVLLNSDTIVTQGWLQRLQACAESAPEVGIVCPLSNNATILSVPAMNHNNPIPAGLSLEQFAALVATASLRHYPCLPVAVGFCMLIRWPVIQRLGYLHDAFHRGYGEECDYSLRAWEAGFEVRCCDDAFVYHEGERSFRAVTGIADVRRRNDAVLHARWPIYTDLVRRYCVDNPLLELQERVTTALCRAKGDDSTHVLQVLHAYETLGGTELHSRSVAEATAERFRTTLLYPGEIADPYAGLVAVGHSDYLRVLKARKPGEPDDVHILGHLATLGDARVEARFARLVAGGGVGVVHFQHLLDWGSLELPLIAKALGAAVVLTLHDYYLFCPVFDLLLPSGQPCGRACADAQAPECSSCLQSHAKGLEDASEVGRYLTERRAKLLAVFACADLIISPSVYVRDKFVSAYGASYSPKLRVIRHGVPELGAPPRPTRQQRLRIGVFANFTRRKGGEVLLDALRRLNGLVMVDVCHYGGADSSYAARLQETGIRSGGVYRLAQLRRLVAEVDLAVVPSVYEETFCLTIAELQSLAVPVVAFAVGAIPERIRDGETGFLVASADASSLASRIAGLVRDTDALDRVRRILRGGSQKSIEDNVAEYVELYAGLPAGEGGDDRMRERQPAGDGIAPSAPGLCRALLSELDPAWGRSTLGYGSAAYRTWLGYRPCDRLGTPTVSEAATPALDVIVYELDRTAGDLQATLRPLRKARAAGLVRVVVISAFSEPPKRPADLSPDVWEEVGAGSAFARALNLWIADRAGAWFLLVECGDRLAVSAPELLRAYVARHPAWRFAYADEDSIAEDERRYAPRFKPDFNLDLMRCQDVVGHTAMVEREAFVAVGGMQGLHERAWHDLCLKIADQVGDQSIGHVPEVLYHRADRRFAPNGSADATDLVSRAVADHLERRRIAAKVVPTGFPGVVWVDYPVPRGARFSVVIATSGDGASVAQAISELESIATGFDVVVLDFQRKGSLWSSLRLADFKIPLRVLRAGAGKTFAHSFARAIQMTQSDAVLVMHDGIRFADRPKAIAMLLGLIARGDVGLAGPCILDLAGRIRHSYKIAGFSPFGATGQLQGDAALTVAGYMYRNVSMQDCATVSDRCYALCKRTLQAVGGFDVEQFGYAWYLLDLGLRLAERGKKVVWTPHAAVTEIHDGSFSRRRNQLLNDQRVAAEVAQLYERWLSRLANDPAHNPNLSLRALTYVPEAEIAVRWDARVSPEPRILGLPGDRAGSGHYRVIDPLNALQTGELACTSVLPIHQDARVPSIVELERVSPTVVLMHNALHDQHLHALELYRRFGNVRLLLSLDDLITDLPDWNPFRQTNYRDMDERLSFALERCDGLVVSTEALASAYAGRHATIRVVPNRIAATRWQPLVSPNTPAPPGAKPRIGWAGAQQHEQDLSWLLPVVEALSERADWHFFGMCPEPLARYATSVEPMVDFARYPQKMTQLSIDVGIAPLALHDFNRCKSNVKILEYGVLGIPVVCSDIEPYRDAPVERLPNDPKRWIEALNERIGDVESARAEGQRLRQWVCDNWLLEDGLQTWLAALV